MICVDHLCYHYKGGRPILRDVSFELEDGRFLAVLGNNYIYLIPGSVLAGAALLLLSDLAARVVIMPVILPIGALTAFLGGPLFLYLLFKGRGRT